MVSFSIRLRDGQEFHYDHPVVMGIINLTPDSFYSNSRCLGGEEDAETQLRARVKQMIRAGAEMIDVGACSTRPGYEPPSAEEELRRLEWGLPIVVSAIHDARCRRSQMIDNLASKDDSGDDLCKDCSVDHTPLPISVDTYRASVAEAAITRLGADIINDVYGGTRDPKMISVVNHLKAPYILTADSNDVPEFFSQQMALIKNAQVILDPGYGFSKTLDENYKWIQRLPELIASFPACPMLVGISRKSMIWKLFNNTPQEALNGTTILNTVALMSGAHILRVHDVNEAVECVKILAKILPMSKV